MKTPSLLIPMLTLFLLAPGEVGSSYQESKEDLVTRQYLHYADKTLIYSDLGRLRAFAKEIR